MPTDQVRCHRRLVLGLIQSSSMTGRGVWAADCSSARQPLLGPRDFSDSRHFVLATVSRRYERGPLILTSNQAFGRWGDVFGDRVIAAAIVDRVLHHAVSVNIRGNSYRLKDKLKSGIV